MYRRTTGATSETCPPHTRPMAERVDAPGFFFVAKTPPVERGTVVRLFFFWAEDLRCWSHLLGVLADMAGRGLFFIDGVERRRGQVGSPADSRCSDVGGCSKQGALRTGRLYWWNVETFATNPRTVVGETSQCFQAMYLICRAMCMARCTGGWTRSRQKGGGSANQTKPPFTVWCVFFGTLSRSNILTKHLPISGSSALAAGFPFSLGHVVDGWDTGDVAADVPAAREGERASPQRRRPRDGRGGVFGPRLSGCTSVVNVKRLTLAV